VGQQWVTAYKRTILNALLDVESALAGELSLRCQQQSAERQRKIQEHVLRETKAKFNSSRISSLDLITEERYLIGIEEQEVEIWL
jgi:outer membrane protein TolC